MIVQENSNDCKNFLNIAKLPEFEKVCGFDIYRKECNYGMKLKHFLQNISEFLQYCTHFLKIYKNFHTVRYIRSQ